MGKHKNKTTFDIWNYKPFEHTNFEFIKGMLDFARTLDKKEAKDIFAAILIYVNAIDYVSSHMLDNLKKITQIITSHELNGIVLYKHQEEKLTLGQVKYGLEKFDFPLKQDYLSDLEEFNELRIKSVHHLLSVSKEDIATGTIDKDFSRLISLADGLITKYDTITRGVSQTFNLYISSKIPPTAVDKPQPEVKKHRNEPKK